MVACVPDPATNPSPSHHLRQSAPVMAIVGAVGRELVGVLKQRKFLVAELLLYASPRAVAGYASTASRAWIWCCFRPA
jgi:hypothetical protein